MNAYELTEEISLHDSFRRVMVRTPEGKVLYIQRVRVDVLFRGGTPCLVLETAADPPSVHKAQNRA